MPTSRREFLTTTAMAGTSMLAVAAPDAVAQPLGPNTTRAGRSLRLLILGGTGFIGPHIVEAALAHGHSMTLFNRGRTNSHLFPALEKLVGDRDPGVGEGLSALEGRTWDAVIDTSGYVPRLVKASVEMLAPATTQYFFVSTVSAYAGFATAGMTEDAPTVTMDDPTIETVNATTYGPLKALCEEVVRSSFPGGATIIRPGLIVGPGDPTHRFTYWPMRIRRGGRVLAPGRPDMKVQYIDARDIARFCIRCVERGIVGTFNAVGPEAPAGMAEMLHGCKAVTGGTATFEWVDAAFLTEQGVQPWQHMPAWVPPEDGYQGFAALSNERAMTAGMTYLPLADTVRDLLAWVDDLPEDQRRALEAVERVNEDGSTTPLPGLTPEHELAVLTAWGRRG